MISSKTRKSTNRAAVLLRNAAVGAGKTQTVIGAFFRRLAARVGKAKAVTATARKLADLFYNAMRFGMSYSDPGVSYYEERYRQRVLHNLHRRARDLGFELVAATTTGVSFLGRLTVSRIEQTSLQECLCHGHRRMLCRSIGPNARRARLIPRWPDWRRLSR